MLQLCSKYILMVMNMFTHTLKSMGKTDQNIGSKMYIIWDWLSYREKLIIDHIRDSCKLFESCSCQSETWSDLQIQFSCGFSISDFVLS